MRIVITGGTSGIGEATAVYLLKKGHTLDAQKMINKACIPYILFQGGRGI